MGRKIIKPKVEEYYRNHLKIDEEELELWNYFPLRKVDSGLPSNLFIDEGESYLVYNHPKWVFVQPNHSTSPTYDYILMTISNDPQFLGNTSHLELSISDINKIKNFVINNKKLLSDIAEMKVRAHNHINYKY